MNTLEAINQRRSIRKFMPGPVPKETIEQVIQAGILAPSSKNSQPWRFVIVEKEKKEMLNAMQAGLENEKTQAGLLPNYRPYLAGAAQSMKIMEQAPVTIFILNPLEKAFFMYDRMEDNFHHLANIQSVGACIENMSLAAQALGLGSLWICDIFFAYRALLEWLGTEEQLVAALSLGYADQKPPARPRKGIDELLEWR